jgi:geranylgeranyl diphosphate synthase, type II
MKKANQKLAISERNQVQMTDVAVGAMVGSANETGADAVTAVASEAVDGSAHGLQSVFSGPARMTFDFLDSYFSQDTWLERTRVQLGERDMNSMPAGIGELVASMRYSLLQEGGKRFRPALAMYAASALGFPKAAVLPYAAAVECIHTYSLIHDDLPSMDDDQVRRGQPTNHIKFGEGTAVLAGDALLTEAFALIADQYSSRPDIISELIVTLARSAGASGMVGGQMIDLAAQGELPGYSASLIQDLASDSERFSFVRRLHRLKTGALIRASVHGAALICGASAAQVRDLVVSADLLGLAFQVADDILDFDPKSPEPGSFPGFLGLEKTKRLLQEITDSALGALRVWPAEADELRALIQHNQSRMV